MGREQRAGDILAEVQPPVCLAPPPASGRLPPHPVRVRRRAVGKLAVAAAARSRPAPCGRRSPGVPFAAGALRPAPAAEAPQPERAAGGHLIGGLGAAIAGIVCIARQGLRGIGKLGLGRRRRRQEAARCAGGEPPEEAQEAGSDALFLGIQVRGGGCDAAVGKENGSGDGDPVEGEPEARMPAGLEALPPL